MPRRRSLIISAVLVTLLGGLGTGTAHADTGSFLYVDNASAVCSDTGPGSQAEPFCQIQPAADAAVPGDTVRIAANKTAYAPVTITSVGTADAPITFNTAPGDGGTGTVSGAGTAATTFSGAEYVNVVGLRTSSRAGALVINNSRHISYTRAIITSTAVAGTTVPAAITVDGASSGISLTRLTVPGARGWAFASSAGAQDITLADDLFEYEYGGGVSASGTTGIKLAGDTISTLCGQAVSLTDGTSGSVENTAVSAGGSTTCSATGTPAEITVDAASAGQVTADYNAVNPLSTGTDYDWAGTAYGTAEAFRTGTGQGAHDLDQTDLTLDGSGYVAEGSPLIDSADADAPGELSTDRNGNARVDDPLVADTGAGTGSYDRGATEFQDPLKVTGVTESSDVYVGIPVTFTTALNNPWSDPLDFTYTFDFGDGGTATSTTGSATHTYTATTTGSATDTLTVVVDRTDGTQFGAAQASFGILPVPALTGSVSCGANTSAPDTAICDVETSYFSQLPVTSDRITFGDGTAAVSVTGSGVTVRHRYAAAGTYTVTQKLADSDGRTATSTTKAIVGVSYFASGPYRVLDTRSGTGAAKRRVGPGGVVRVKILGRGGVPASGVAAVLVNITDVNATAASAVTVYPDRTGRPAAADLFFRAGQTNSNLATVRVGKDGYIDLYNAHGNTNLVADVEGYYTTKSSTSDMIMTSLAPVAPAKVLDTRVGPRSVTTVTLPKIGRGMFTIGAVLGVTVSGGTANGSISVYCWAGRTPSAVTLNYRAGQTVSNLAVPAVCTGGKIKFYNSAGHVHLTAGLQALLTNQLAGYTEADTTSPAGGPFVPTAPTRLLAKSLGANSTLSVKVAGVHGVPTGATAVLVNLTGTGPTRGTHLTAYGDGTLPKVANLYLVAGETRSVLALVPVDADGYIHLHNTSGSVKALVDLQGYIG
jgi:hypothetical protein